MSEENTTNSMSALRRIIVFFDPAREGFLGRMLRLFIVFALIAACAAAALVGTWFRTETGRHFLAHLFVDLDLDEQAVPIAVGLVEDYPGKEWEYYRLAGMSLRRVGRYEESLEMYDRAIEALPDEWWAHSHRCFYTTILTGESEPVLDSCDRSIELEPTSPGVAYDRRAIARAVAGDLDGALADLAQAIEFEERRDWRGYSRSQQQARYAWLEALRSGENPIDDEELRLERMHY